MFLSGTNPYVKYLISLRKPSGYLCVERGKGEGGRGRENLKGRRGGKGVNRGQVAPVNEDLEQKDLMMGLS